jgi:hypothetical protein
MTTSQIDKGMGYVFKIPLGTIANYCSIESEIRAHYYIGTQYYASFRDPNNVLVD